MERISLQAAPPSTLFGEAIPGLLVRGKIEGIERRPNSASVSSIGCGRRDRGVAKSFWISEDVFLIGLSRAQSLEKRNSRQVSAERVPKWREGWSWSSGGIRRGNVRAGNGEFSANEDALDRNLDNSNGNDPSEKFFVDQNYECGREDDLNPVDPLTEAVREKYIEKRFADEKNTQGGNLDASIDEEVLQRSIRRQGQAYPSSTGRDGRSLVEERENSDLAFGKSRDYDDVYDRRGSMPKRQRGTVDENQSPAPSRDFEGRNDFQSRGIDEIAGIGVDGEQGQVLPNRGGRNDRDTDPSGEYWGRSSEQVLSTRGDLYAKQVISLSTAQNLGFVTQLWVDVENLKVVAIEVRPSLLFGNFNSFLLRSLSKVGDVVLIHDDDVVLKARDLFGCSDLVGNQLFTEDGLNLGKVRDYHFSLEDGAVLSLEYDNFGVPLIPSTLIKTYSLTIDEVIEAQGENLLVREGAGKRAQKLSKGLFNRSKERGSPWRRQRKQPPEIRYLGQGSERFGGDVVESEEYSPAYATPRQQPKNTDSRRMMVDESLANDTFEGDQSSQDLYPGKGFLSEDLALKELEDYQNVPSSRTDAQELDDSPQILDNEEAQGQGFGMPKPEISQGGWGLPMRYRNSRRRVDKDS